MKQILTFVTMVIIFSGTRLIYADEPVLYDYGDEPMRYLENDRVKLGINLSIGGAVTFLTDAKNGGGNMINSADWGRQIQLSYYSGPKPFIGPDGEKPSETWASLGWNPIQSGDYAGNRSKVIEFKQRTSDSFYVKTIPMLWPHANLPAECTFECLYTLKDNYFILDATINNNRSDRTQYPADNQEMPAVYTNGPWYRLVTYLGTKPFENEPVTVVFDKGDNKGWPCPGYYTPERWSALLDENGYGIGVYQGDSTFMSGGFAGGDAAKGTGGEKDGQTGYITPFSPVILDWNICKTYRTVFILGTVDEIRQKANEIALSTLPKIPRWDFDSGRENWYYTGQMKDSGYPLSQCLDVSFNGDTDNAMVGPQTFWKAEDTKNLEIDAMFTGDGDDETDNGISEEQELTISISPVSPYDCTDHLRWSDAGHSMDEETEVKLKMFPILPDIIVKVPVKFNGGRQVWSVDLSVFEKYTGAMKGLKISFPPVAGRAKIYGIRFTEK